MRIDLKAGLLACLCSWSAAASAALDAQLLQVQRAEVQMLRTGTELFVHRGEGGHAELTARVEAQLLAFKDSLARLEAAPLSGESRALLEALTPHRLAFEIKILEGLVYDPASPELPWQFNFEFARVQRALLLGLERLGRQAQQAHAMTPLELRLLDLPAKIQSLASRYTARAYIGDIDSGPDEPAHYLSQDIDALASSIDADLLALEQGLGPGPAREALRPLATRWKFIRGRLLDYQDNLAPLVVARQAGEMAEGLLRLQAL
ncbi:MAG: hypothetical protein ABWY06_07340 [Pseudomonas sp.]|uniref:hypothetical protein n=1 Tax=Pseudomonas sp. TaxID=306 RepID=UPI0033953116